MRARLRESELQHNGHVLHVSIYKRLKPIRTVPDQDNLLLFLLLNLCIHFSSDIEQVKFMSSQKMSSCFIEIRDSLVSLWEHDL